MLVVCGGKTWEIVEETKGGKDKFWMIDFWADRPSNVQIAIAIKTPNTTSAMITSNIFLFVILFIKRLISNHGTIRTESELLISRPLSRNPFSSAFTSEGVN